MQTASQMTIEGISDSMLAGLKKLRDEGKNLGNGWDVMELSFSGIVGGAYCPAYGHGGPETLGDTVMRMSSSGSTATDLLTLRKIIKAMEMALGRNEFTEDPSLLLAKGWIESDLVGLNQTASELESRRK